MNDAHFISVQMNWPYYCHQATKKRFNGKNKKKLAATEDPGAADLMGTTAIVRFFFFSFVFNHTYAAFFNIRTVFQTLARPSPITFTPRVSLNTIIKRCGSF